MSYKNLYFDSIDKQLRSSIGIGHICTNVGKYLVFWGGSLTLISERENENENKNLLWIFDTELEKWRNIATKENENSPISLSGSCSILVNQDLYLFGGSNKLAGLATTYSNNLFKLSLKTFRWEKISSEGKQPSPRDKTAGWLFDEKLFYFGGFGPNFNNYLDSNGNFEIIQNLNSNLGWNNQLIAFDLKTNKWIDKKLIKAPKPRAAHTCTKLNTNKVVLFGGRTSECRADDLYLIDLNNFSCSGNLSEKIVNKPCARSWHSMLKLDEKSLFLYGGLSRESNCLGDGWLLNVNTIQWTKIEVSFEPRIWHTIVKTNESSDIYVFGGSSSDIYINPPKFLSHIIKINLAPETLKRKCIDYMCSNMKYFEKTLKKKKSEIPHDLEDAITKKAN